MSRKFAIVGIASAAIALVAIWAALPFLPFGEGAFRNSLDPDRGKGAMVFVESPEVYTRQRLVNDRYEQDAWLRAKLREINDPDSIFISERRERELRATLGINTDAAAIGNDTNATAASDGGLPATPFRERFDLQAAARDMIRQRILENALDDRHDLSGNTVFGLKFDTAVLPGNYTRLNPTVVVKMDVGDVNSAVDPSEWAHHFKRRYDPEEDQRLKDSPEAATLQLINRTFSDWTHNVEARLNARKDRSSTQCVGTRNADPLSDVQLCDGTALSSAARTELVDRFKSFASSDSALGDVLRIPGGEASVRQPYLDRVLENATAQCSTSEGSTVSADQPNLGDFLQNEQAYSQRFSVPEPWGQFFDLTTGFKINPQAGCAFNADPLQLQEVDLALIISEGDVSDNARGRLSEGGWSAIPCTIDACIDGGMGVWYQQPHANSNIAVGQILDDVALSTLIGSLSDQDFSEQCFVEIAADEPYFFVGDSKDFLKDGETLDDIESACLSGNSLQFRLGAFGFLKKMQQVESYTYAAFPRGDVSGVVKETNDAAAFGAAAPGNTARGLFGLSRRTSSVETQPTVINFASGEDSGDASGNGAKVFDFGWSIVKKGTKKPMLASQLVLVSVPIYLDRITLTTWTGLLDPDEVPLDRSSYNGLNLEDRIDAVMPSFEKREMTINLPRMDVQLLDSLVVGSRRITGPSIDLEYPNDCQLTAAAGPVSIVVPGDRLWRSTVVLLDNLRADRIEVMPDMRGLLATFEAPEFAGRRSEDAEKSQRARPAALAPGTHTVTVWTSESSVSGPITLKQSAGDC